MTAIAERLIFRVPTAAQGNFSSATEVEAIPVLIKNFKVSLNANRSISSHSNFGRCQFFSPYVNMATPKGRLEVLVPPESWEIAREP